MRDQTKCAACQREMPEDDGAICRWCVEELAFERGELAADRQREWDA